jgi:hypothetical protein
MHYATLFCSLSVGVMLVACAPRQMADPTNALVSEMRHAHVPLESVSKFVIVGNEPPFAPQTLTPIEDEATFK